MKYTFLLAWLLISSQICAAYGQETTPPPTPSEKKAGSQPAPPKKQRVLTNEDFPSGRNPQPETRPSPEPTDPSTPAPRVNQKEVRRVALRTRAKEIMTRMSTIDSQIGLVKVRLEELKGEEKAVSLSQVKDGKTYLRAVGPRGEVVYIPVKTDEDQRLKSRLQDLELDATRAQVEWEYLIDEVRRAGFTIQQVLKEDDAD
ncbi:MAG: hypothetical protein HY774_20065 [Acidobacteria bacterium]|nr:hypothetical protein [Acidobacteriota bacterium]